MFHTETGEAPARAIRNAEITDKDVPVLTSSGRSAEPEKRSGDGVSAPPDWSPGVLPPRIFFNLRRNLVQSGAFL